LMIDSSLFIKCKNGTLLKTRLNISIIYWKHIKTQYIDIKHETSKFEDMSKRRILIQKESIQWISYHQNILN